MLGNYLCNDADKDKKKLGIKQFRFGLGCLTKVSENLSRVQFGSNKEDRLPGDLYP